MQGQGGSISLERRNAFDRMALGCISYLEHCDSCRGVNFQGYDPCTASDLSQWERKNAPCKLPQDLKKLYLMMNGFNLSWTVEVGDKVVTIGEMRLNRLDNITRCTTESVVSSPMKTLIKNAEPSSASIIPGDLSRCFMYSLDSNCDLGEIILLFDPYQEGSEAPTVWLLDSTGSLTFISHTFTQYMRLLIVHLGISGWQGTFLPHGLPEITQHWMALFCRERLLVDKHNEYQVQATALYHTNQSSLDHSDL